MCVCECVRYHANNIESEKKIWTRAKMFLYLIKRHSWQFLIKISFLRNSIDNPELTSSCFLLLWCIRRSTFNFIHFIFNLILFKMECNLVTKGNVDVFYQFTLPTIFIARKFRSFFLFNEVVGRLCRATESCEECFPSFSGHFIFLLTE